MIIEEKFKNNPERFIEFRKKIIGRIAISIPLMLLISFVINWNSGVAFDWTTAAIILPVIIFGIYKGIAMNKKIFDSYELTLDGHSITRKQDGTPDISISYSDITSVTKNFNGSITVKGKSALNAIGIFAQIENPERITGLLAAIIPITEKTNKQPFFEKYNMVISVIFALAFMAIYVSNNKIVVAICGTLTIISFVAGFIILGKTKNVHKSVKWGIWFYPFVLLSLLVMMYYKLSA
jgi:hypothetical protein